MVSVTCWDILWLWNSTWLFPNLFFFWKQQYLLSGSHLLFATEQQKHLQSGGGDLAAWCKPSEQTPNHSREREEKYGEIKRRAQMLHCRWMLIILMQGQEKNAQWTRCVEEVTPMGKLLAEEQCLLQTGQRRIIHLRVNVADSSCTVFVPQASVDVCWLASDKPNCPYHPLPL